MPNDLEFMIVGDVMSKWPETVPVFVRCRMACPGCVMAPFMTVAEAATEYGYKPETFAAELAGEIEKATSVSPRDADYTFNT